MYEIKLRARAKINLTLDVTGRRENGYHDLLMVMQTLALYDGVYIKKIEKPTVRLKTNLSWLPTDQRNLASRGAMLLRERFHIREGVFILLEKHIPVAAGLAGGSADCAAVLVGMNKLFQLNLSLKELMEIGLTLGTDIPYCIMRGTALASGLGEDLQRIEPVCPAFSVVLVKPPVNVSTAFVYQHLDLNHIYTHPDTHQMLAAIRRQDAEGICAHLENVLETVTIPLYPQIQQIKNRLIALGAKGALMSGSGPTVYGLFENKTKAEAAAFAMKQESLHKDDTIIVTKIWGHEERRGT